MPLCPAPAPARAAFSPKVPSGLTGRAPAWGAALSGCCPSRSPGRQDAEQRAERTKPFRAHQHRRRAVVREHHGHPRPAPARGGDRDCTGPAKTCGALNLTTSWISRVRADMGARGAKKYAPCIPSLSPRPRWRSGMARSSPERA